MRFLFDVEPNAGRRLLKSMSLIPRNYSSTVTMWVTLLIMPRISGVSLTTTVWFRRRKPRPLITLLKYLSRPIALRLSVTLISPAIVYSVSGLFALVCRQSAPGENLLGAVQPLQGTHGGLDDIVRIVRSDAFGQNVADSRHLEDSARGAAGDHAGPFGCRHQQHLARPVLADYVIGDGLALQRNIDHVLLGSLHTLADRFRNFLCLAQS